MIKISWERVYSATIKYGNGNENLKPSFEYIDILYFSIYLDLLMI